MVRYLDVAFTFPFAEIVISINHLIIEGAAGLSSLTTLEMTLPNTLPSHWAPLPENGYLLVDVEEGTAEYNSVVAHWNILSPVERIVRVQNWNLWRQFQFHRSLILEKVGDAQLNERNLWHGTHGNAAKSISHQGRMLFTCFEVASFLLEAITFASKQGHVGQ